MDQNELLLRYARAVFAAFLLLTGIVTCVLFLPSYFEAQSSLNWPSVMGMLDRAEPWGDNGYIVPMIRYSYSVDGRSYSGRRIETTDIWSKGPTGASEALSGLVEGEPIRVYYDPADPARAVLKPGTRRWGSNALFLPAGTFGFGVVLAWWSWQTWPRDRTGTALEWERATPASLRSKLGAIPLSRWVAPFLGAAIGTAVSFRVRSGPEPASASHLLLGATLGGIAGLCVLLLDPRRKSSAGTYAASFDGESGSLVQRFFAVAAIVLFLAPFVGVLLGLAAWTMNRRIHGWPRAASLAGLVLSSAWTLFTIGVIVFYRPT
jgi:hypothetical protein